MPPDRLALAIPTYNRPSILLENLRCMLLELKAHQVPVYISDDSDNEETERMIEGLQLEYERIYYRRNEPSLGHDLNCVSTLAWPDAEYVWYMGDSLYFKPGTLDSLFDILRIQPEFVFLNSYVKKDRYKSGIIQDWKKFVIDTMWYLTLSGATVYSASAIDQIKYHKIDNKMYPNFVQLGIILECLSNRPRKIYWFNENSIDSNAGKRSYWLKSAIKVFVIDWVHFVESFPIFSDYEKNTIIRSHSAETGLFSLKNLIIIRANGGISFSIWMKHRSDIERAFHSPGWFGLLVSLIPKGLLIYLMRQQKNKNL